MISTLQLVRPTWSPGFEYAADRTFVHQEGTERHYNSALAAWTRHRVVAAAGVEVFGQNPGDLCPAKAWHDARRSG